MNFRLSELYLKLVSCDTYYEKLLNWWGVLPDLDQITGEIMNNDVKRIEFSQLIENEFFRLDFSP